MKIDYLLYIKEGAAKNLFTWIDWSYIFNARSKEHL